jgi:hypothetical protein
MTTGHPGTPAATPDHDAACWQAAAQARRQHPGWIVIWVAQLGRFRAYPLFRAPSGTSVTAATPQELTAGMEQAEQAARRPRGRSHRTGPAVR